MFDGSNVSDGRRATKLKKNLLLKLIENRTFRMIEGKMGGNLGREIFFVFFFQNK